MTKIEYMIKRMPCENWNVPPETLSGYDIAMEIEPKTLYEQHLIWAYATLFKGAFNRISRIKINSVDARGLGLKFGGR